MFNVDRLRVLHAVSEYGSVVGAADVLHVTTSAVSQQLGKLEREAGQQLVARSGRGVRLTDAGKLLAGHAGRVLSQLEVAAADLEAYRGRAVGELRIGTFPTAARGLFPATLRALRADHPRLRPRLTEMEQETSLPALVRGDLDVALLIDWDNRPLPLPPDVVRVALLDDPVDVAVPAGHPLAGRARVRLEDLAEDEWVTCLAGEFCHEWLLVTLRAAGVEPRLSHTAGENHTQLTLVGAGLGVAISPRLGRGRVPEDVAIVPVECGTPRHVYAAWRADADPRPSIRAMVAALEKAAREVEGAV